MPPDRRAGAADGHEPTLAAEDAETLAHDGSQPSGDIPPGGELAPGARLGRYKLGARIGAGAMGVVWSARDPKLDRAVAIKVVHPALARTPDAAARLLREARAMAKVSHRAVVAVHDAGETNGQLYLAMELVEGTTLGRMLRERDDAARRDWRRWLGLMVEAGGGLVAAHAAGIVHRDFKPDNVLVARDGRVCVGDFGVAELTAASRSAPAAPADDGPSASTSGMNLVDLTTTGALVGTPAYMSPEQLRGSDADARSDQFAFCVALHEAVYGVRPFALPPRPEPAAVANLIETIEQQRIEPAPRDSRVPPWVRDAIVRGLAPAPADRWPSVAALLGALARPPGLPRAWWIGGAAMAIAAMSAAGVAYLALRGDAARPTSHAVETGPLEARGLYPVPMRPALALSPDGTRVAIGSADRLVVRELDGDRVWQFDHKGDRAVNRIEMPDATHVQVSLTGKAGPPELVVWNLETNEIESRRTLAAGARWLGEVTGGTLISRLAADARAFELRVLDASGERTIATGTGRLEVHAISPDRTRVAYVEPVGFAGQAVIVDVATGAAIRGAPIVELTGLAWQDASTLWLTTGTTTEPALHDAVVEAGAIAAPRKRYGKPRGWFGQVVSANGRTLLVDSANSFRAKLVSPTGAVQDLDPELVGAALGWLDETRWLAWNRTTGDLAPDDDRPEQRIAAAIDGEPANATLADEIAIVAMRKPGGREVTASSLTAAKQLWRLPVGAATAVRCAGDRRPPCFAIVEPSTGDALVHAIDPRTAAVGAEVARGPGIADVAVSADGTQLLVCDGSPTVRVLDLEARTEQTIKVDMSNTRSVAFEPGGGVLIAGTRAPVTYQVLRVRGADHTVLLQSDNEILFQPRAAPDGHATLVMGRLFMPHLYEIVGPAE